MPQVTFREFSYKQITFNNITNHTVESSVSLYNQLQKEVISIPKQRSYKKYRAFQKAIVKKNLIFKGGS